MTDPVNADCRTGYTAVHHGGTRNVKDITLIVLHSTEGGTAKSVAEYFTTKASGGSAHLVVDDDACYRCLANNVIPWGAPGTNGQGFHIEQCGYAVWSALEWKQHVRTLDRAAFKTAYHCHLFHIPVVFVVAHDLAEGKRGITTHAEVSKAWPNDAGNHTDPGLGWPRAFFLGLVRKHYNELADPAV